MIIDKYSINGLLDELANLFNALEHNDMGSSDIEEAIHKVQSVRNTFCNCKIKHHNKVKICSICNKTVYIQFDGLT